MALGTPLLPLEKCKAEDSSSSSQLKTRGDCPSPVGAAVPVDLATPRVWSECAEGVSLATPRVWSEGAEDFAAQDQDDIYAMQDWTHISCNQGADAHVKSLAFSPLALGSIDETEMDHQSHACGLDGFLTCRESEESGHHAFDIFTPRPAQHQKRQRPEQLLKEACQVAGADVPFRRQGGRRGSTLAILKHQYEQALLGKDRKQIRILEREIQQCLTAGPIIEERIWETDWASVGDLCDHPCGRAPR